VGICSINREEWLVTDLASNLIDVTSVPLYDTLGDEMLEIILNQTEITTMFGSDVCLKNIIKIITGKKTNLKQVVTFDKVISAPLKEAAETNKITIISYHELLEKYREKHEIYDEQKNSLDSVFTISYTSGTSGNSKGVMLSNRNFLSAITNIMQMANQFKFTHEDVYISYLPLAHVFDRLGCHTILSQGGQIGFFGGKILEITQDLQLLRPTIFPSVPRLLNKVYERVMTGVQDLSITRRFLFYQALVSKSHYNKEYGWTNNQVFDSLVLSKAKERLGGRVRIMITGSAPIAPNVLAFLRCIFCCPIVEAYG
jgi:long-chain acyl-CoA synthetase